MYSIYKIINDDGRIYIGSTKQPINHRFSCHKYKIKKGFSRCSLKEFNMDTAKIELIENLDGDIEDILYKERNYIENMDCVNKDRPIVSDEEKKIKFKESYKIWNIKVDCECGSKYSKSHKNRHLKTEKHLKFINSK